jgi:hypothetical protein
MTGYRGALDLSNELLHDILDRIAADDPGRLVSVDKRAYLSQESFRPDPLPSQDQIVNIGKFRLLCRRFAALGASHQFARVTTRFSSKGLARLEAIADQPHLAKHVKKFSYKVPYFCTQGTQIHGIVQRLPRTILLMLLLKVEKVYKRWTPKYSKLSVNPILNDFAARSTSSRKS